MSEERKVIDNYYDDEEYWDNDGDPDYWIDDEDEYLCDYGSEGCLIDDANYCIKKMTDTRWKRFLNWLLPKRRHKLRELYMTKAIEVNEWCSFLCPNRPKEEGN